jgi:hypothetical protein
MFTSLLAQTHPLALLLLLAISLLLCFLLCHEQLLRIREVMKLVRLIPPAVRFPLTVALFWPTVAYSRLYYALFPKSRRLFDRVHPNIVLGAAPIQSSEIRGLFDSERVKGVVNLCMEWDGHGTSKTLLGHPQTGLYAALGIEQVWAPTVDFDAPSLQDTLRCVSFIHAQAQMGNSVYVHWGERERAG